MALLALLLELLLLGWVHISQISLLEHVFLLLYTIAETFELTLALRV